MLTNWHMHAMLALVLRSLSRPPSTIAKQLLIFQPENLNLQRPTALDHFFLAVTAKAPKRKVTTRASTYDANGLAQSNKIRYT